MALASVGDVEVALGRSLTAQESSTVDHLLNTASDRVASFLGGTPDPVPGEVMRVVADVVVAVLTKPATTTADYQAGGYYQQREVTTTIIAPDATATNTGPWLSKEQKARLRPFIIKGGGGSRRAYMIDLEPAEDGWVDQWWFNRTSRVVVLDAPFKG